MFSGFTARDAIGAVKETMSSPFSEPRLRYQKMEEFSMLKKMTFILLALAIFMVVPALAQDGDDDNDSGCRSGKFVGAYTSPLINQDVFGDGSVFHTWVYQLNLHSGGTADQYVTADLDYIVNAGSISPAIGSWTCRKDGKLVVTLLEALYSPVASSAPNVPNPDIALTNHIRATYLFSIVDRNTLQNTQRRSRVYDSLQDPTDPAGGHLGHLITAVREYKRLKASDADLLAP